MKLLLNSSTVTGSRVLKKPRGISCLEETFLGEKCSARKQRQGMNVPFLREHIVNSGGVSTGRGVWNQRATTKDKNDLERKNTAIREGHNKLFV